MSHVLTCWPLALNELYLKHPQNSIVVTTPETGLTVLIIPRFRSQRPNRVPVEDGGKNRRASWCLGPKPSEEVKLKGTNNEYSIAGPMIFA